MPDQSIVMTRIAEALERIANSLEQQNRPALKRQIPNDDHKIDPEWLELAERVVAGENMKAIGISIDRSPTVVRKKVLAVFKLRNPKKYEEIQNAKAHGCYQEPSIKVLIRNGIHFGFKSS